MTNPYVTIVFVPTICSDECQLLLLYTNGEYYYSAPHRYKELMFFLKSSKIETNDTNIIVYSKNGKQTLEIQK